MIYDCAVVIPTVLRPELARAVQSVYAQDFPGTVQIMIGVDVVQGDAGIIDALRATCPERMELTVVDPGYSTNRRNGGFYDIWGGGSLRTILSYAANSRYIAYLDDDNWMATNHLSTLRTAIEGHHWAHSLRWYVDPDALQPVCVDEWESVGVGRGMYAKIHEHGGHVDANCYMLDKDKCHWVFPAWSASHVHSLKTVRKGSGGEDRSVFRILRNGFAGANTGQATIYYVMSERWRKILHYILQPGDPEAIEDPKEKQICILASRLREIAAAERQEAQGSTGASTVEAARGN